MTKQNIIIKVSVAITSALLAVSLMLVTLGVFHYVSSFDMLYDYTFRGLRLLSIIMSATLQLPQQVALYIIISSYIIFAFFIYDCIFHIMKKNHA